MPSVMCRALVTAVAVLAGLVTTTGSAPAAGPGAVPGRAVDTHGAPVGGACVREKRAGQASVETRSGWDGSWRLDGVPAGTALLIFDRCDTPSPIAPQWYRDAVREGQAL